MPKLVFTDAKFAGRHYEFVREKTTLGRADDNLLVIRDTSISSHHCEILVNGTEVIVRDLDSRNGTFVNGQRLKDQQTQVRTGATVRFGTVEARVEIERPDPRDDATEITAVYTHGRVMTKARRQTQPTDPAMRLEPSGEAESGEQTILMPREAVPEPAPAAAPAVAQPAPAAQPPGRGRWLALAVAAVVVVAGLLIWLLRLRQ